MAAVALTGAGNVTTAESGSAAELSPAKPANTSDGDLLWGVFYHRNNGATLTAPSGWELAKDEDGNGTFALWVKPIADAASEPSSYTFSTGGGMNRCVAAVGRITGADLDDPVDAVGATSSTNGTSSLVHPSVTATQADCLLLAVSTNNLSSATPAAFTADAAMTEVVQVDVSPSSSSSMQVAQEALTSAGATGTRTATMSPSANNSAGFMVTIAPGGEAHSGSATITAVLGAAAAGTPAVDGSAAVDGGLAVAATGTPAVTGGSASVGMVLKMTASGTADTGIGTPPRPRTRWQLVLGPASGGHELALTEAHNRRYTARLTENSDLSFSLDGRHPQAAAIAELSTDVHLLFSDAGGTRILDRCRVGQTRDDIGEDDHRVEVTCLDYRAVLERRYLYSGDTLTFEDVDQAEIAWSLVDDTQAKRRGSLGIAKGWTGTTPTGITRDHTYEAGDSIGQRIQELSQLLDGFDWDISPVSASGLQLDVWYPQRGSDRGVVLILGGLAAHVQREVDPSDYANAIQQSGGEDTETGEWDSEVLLGDPPEGRWEAVFADDGLTTQFMVGERASWQLKQSQVVRPAYTVRLKRGGWEGPDHIWLGDTVRLIIPSGRLRVDTTARVYEIQLDIDEDGGETATLTLGGPRPDFRRWPAKVDRRLRNLERR